MDFTYLKETLDQSNRYKDLALLLTTTIENVLRHSSMDPYDRYQLVKSLIRAHETYPCINSPEWLEQWREEFKNVLLPANPVLRAELEELPY